MPREPVHYRWFWIGVVALVAAGSPWYLPPGSFEPVVLGVPYWVWVSVGLSFVFCFYVRWACLRLWKVAADRDERPTSSRDGEAV